MGTETTVLAERLLIARRRRQMRQDDLATAIAVSAQTVSRWENGDREPRASDLSALADALGVSVAWLLGGDTGFAADPEGVTS